MPLRKWLEVEKEQDGRSFVLCKAVEYFACNGTGKDIRLFMDWKGNHHEIASHLVWHQQRQHSQSPG